MTTLHDLFDYDQFLLQVASGNIVVRTNDSGSLSVANYGPTVQFSRSWSPESTASRGLIFDTQTLEVLARPWPKFFNWDDSTAPYPPSGSVIKSEKFDGSMGILYFDKEDNVFKVASRGSFRSEQAIKATEMFHALDHPQQIACEDSYFSGHTVLFEIIFPSNRIVLDYGSEERLVLLDVLNTETGKPALDVFDDMFWYDKADKTLLPSFIDTMAGDIPKNKEGFVLYWPHHDFRCKVKGADYVALHSILTETSSRNIWQYLAVNACRDLGDAKAIAQGLGMDPRDVVSILKTGENWFEDMIKDVPDEFYSWMRRTIKKIESKYESNMTEIRSGVGTATEESGGITEIAYGLVEDSIFCKHILRIWRDIPGAVDSAILNAWKNSVPVYEKPFSDRSLDTIELVM